MPHLSSPPPIAISHVLSHSAKNEIPCSAVKPPEAATHAIPSVCFWLFEEQGGVLTAEMIVHSLLGLMVTSLLEQLGDQQLDGLHLRVGRFGAIRGCIKRGDKRLQCQKS